MSARRLRKESLSDIVLRGLHDLAPLSDVVTKTLEATERESTTSAEIERLVSTDAALSAKILRVVNSAYYGLAGEVFSLNQAVVVLGMQQIRNLVLSVSVLGLLKSQTPEWQATQQRLWLHSFSSAACAQALARTFKFGPRDAEAVYTGGLLHDIGKLYLFSALTEEYVAFCERAEAAGECSDDLEQATFGMGHDEIGGMLAERWHFPNALRDLISLHEGPFDEDASPLLLAVHVADRLTSHGYGEEGRELCLDPVAERWLDTAPGARAAVVAEMETKIAEASELFGVLLQ